MRRRGRPLHPLYGTPMDMGSHDKCQEPGHVCVLCEYPKWYATLDRVGREKEAARIKGLQEADRVAVAAGTYRGRLGVVVSSVSVVDDDGDDDDEDAGGGRSRAEVLQDLAFAACEAAAVLAVAEVRGRGVRAARRVEAASWGALVAAFAE